MKILVIDDSALVRVMIKKSLQPFNYEILELASGDDFLQQIKRVSLEINLIILDINLPGTGGLQLLEVLKRHPKYCGVPVIILTGQADYRTVKKAIELGADDYLIKPFKPEELVLRVNRTLKDHGWTGEDQFLTDSATVEKQLEIQIKRSRRSNTEFGVLLFKFPAAGNKLRETLVLLQTTLRETDLIFRFDQDWVVFIFPYTGPEGLGVVEKKLKNKIEQGNYSPKFYSAAGTFNGKSVNSGAEIINEMKKSLLSGLC